MQVVSILKSMAALKASTPSGIRSRKKEWLLKKCMTFCHSGDLNSPPEKEKEDCWKVYSMITDEYMPSPERLRDWLEQSQKQWI
jgi:hypothetical protein